MRAPASHGFVVIASDNAFVTAAELKAGIDWLIMENERMEGVPHAGAGERGK